jgi:hypothetical protein
MGASLWKAGATTRRTDGVRALAPESLRFRDRGGSFWPVTTGGRPDSKGFHSGQRPVIRKDSSLFWEGAA